MKKLIPLALVLLSVSQTFSQDKSPTTGNPPLTNNLSPNATHQSITNIVPPNPDAASLGKYGDIPVSLYTGIPNIEIPLYQINRAVSVPISLSYHASGVKVDEIASLVGLGWSLNAGGVITRSIHGTPDELSGGLQTTDGRTKFDQYRLNLMTSTQKYDYENKVIGGQYDTEPDEYFYNFLGRSGKLVFDENGAIYLLNHEKLKVSKTVGGFEIIDEKGTKYNFTEIETSRPTTYCFDKNPSFTAETAWYLSSIVPLNGRSITFTYITRSAATYTQGLNQTNRYFVTNHQVCTDDIQTPCKSVYQAAVKQLQQISFDLGTVNFTYEPRADIGTGSNFYRLKELEVRNLANTLIKKVGFVYTYNNAPLGNPVDRYVLKEVNDITDTGIPPIQFKMEYYHFDDLPARNSNAQDHWGYYNNNSSITMIPPIPLSRTFTWADREPDAEKSKYGILTKIIYPTGGNTTFAYEAHDYGYEKTSQGVNLVAITGGLRIQKMTHVDGTSPNQIRRYEYRMSDNPARSSGILVNKPGYSYNYTEYISDGGGQSIGCQFVIASSSSQAYLGTTQGSHVGYEEVTEFYEDGTALNGKTWHKFSSYRDFPDGGSPDTFPFAPVTSHDNARGQLKENKVYRYNGSSFDPVKYTINTHNYEEFSSVIGLKLMKYEENAPFFSHEVQSGQYNYKQSWAPLAETNEYNYQDDGTNGIHTKQSFQYGSDHFQIKEAQTIHSTFDRVNINRIDITRYKYPLDYNTSGGGLDPNATAIKDMQDKNVVTQLIEAQNIVKENGVEKLQSATVNTYYPTSALLKESYSFVSPVGESTWTNSTITGGNFQKDSHYQLDVSYDSYDNYGNIRQRTPRNGIPESYVWGYDSKLPIIKAVGVPYSSLTSINANPHLLTTDNDINSFGQQVRNISEDAQTYTYDLLRGLKTLTAPSAINLSFDFDNLGRLKRIKNHDAYLTDWFNYAYASGSPGCAPPNAPTIAITASSLCSVDMNATGCAGTVNWSNGTIGNNITIDTKNSVSYTANCTVSGCTSSASNTLTVPALPSGWTAQQIGSPPVNGCAQEISGTWIIRGSGNTFNTSDNYNYAYKTHTGNSVIVAKIASMSANTGGMRSGVMLRSSTSPTADYYQFIFDSGNQVLSLFEQKNGTGDGQLGWQATTIPSWIRLKKDGTTISVWYSQSASPVWNNDADWTLYTNVTSSLFNGTYLLGILAYNNDFGNNSLINETQFTNVSTFTF